MTTEAFTSRDEIVKFIEAQTSTAIEKSLTAPRVERRLPWVTTGPVGQDSAGYSMLKAAAFALGYVGPEQAKEEIQTHQQLRELYAGYGFLPHHGAQSVLGAAFLGTVARVRAARATFASGTATKDDRERREVRPRRSRLDRSPHRAVPPKGVDLERRPAPRRVASCKCRSWGNS